MPLLCLQPSFALPLPNPVVWHSRPSVTPSLLDLSSALCTPNPELLAVPQTGWTPPGHGSCCSHRLEHPSCLRPPTVGLPRKRVSLPPPTVTPHFPAQTFLFYCCPHKTSLAPNHLRLCLVPLIEGTDSVLSFLCPRSSALSRCWDSVRGED